MARKFRVVIGGNDMANAVAVTSKKAATAVHSVEARTDWDELSEWGYSETKRTGMTESDSKELLQQVRKMLNDCSCR